MAADKWLFTIGGQIIDRFEVPEHFDLGHEIKLAEHDFIDESGQPQRRVHAMGAFDVPTSWKGMFYSGDNGDSALNRATILDNMAIAQQEVLWQWGPLQFNVFIKKFMYTPHFNNEIEYDIELVVISSLNGSTTQPDGVLAYDSSTAQFFTSANSSWVALTSAPDGTIGLPQSLVQVGNDALNAVTAASPLGNQTVAQILAILSLLNQAISAIETFEAPMEAWAVFEADLTLLDLSFQCINNFGLLQSSLSQLVGVTPGSPVIQNFTGSLYTLAAQYYPNVQADVAASAIAQANGLVDLFVTTPTSIALPPIYS